MESATRVVIVGTGSWGTALAVMLARHRPVTLVARTPLEAAALRGSRRNERFLPDTVFPDSLAIEHDPERALEAPGLVIVVVPAAHLRPNLAVLQPWLRAGHILLSGIKGLELTTGLRMTQVIERELGSASPVLVGALSGPNIAREIAEGRPASTVVASRHSEVLAEAVALLSAPQWRVYANTDVVGVELGGALKNIIAIGAGAIDGLGAGQNAKAAFVTRGLAEIARLGVEWGANPLTFAGLAGLGDLLTTVSSPSSRNRRAGEMLARGAALDEITASLAPQVAEGIETTRAVWTAAAAQGVRMPITEQTYRVLYEQMPIGDAVDELMLRKPKYEIDAY